MNKGFSTQERGTPETYGSVQLMDGRRGAMDVIPSWLTKVNIVPLVVGASSSQVGETTIIHSVAHTAKAGQTVRFVTGANAGLELLIVSVIADFITVAGKKGVTLPVAAETFDFFRRITPTVGPDGGITVTVTTLPILMTEGTFIDFSLTVPITDAAWVTVYTLTSNSKKMAIGHQSGATLILGINGVAKGVIYPGMDAQPFEFAANLGDTIDIRAWTGLGPYVAGSLYLNFFN